MEHVNYTFKIFFTNLLAVKHIFNHVQASINATFMPELKHLKIDVFRFHQRDWMDSSLQTNWQKMLWMYSLHVWNACIHFCSSITLIFVIPIAPRNSHKISSVFLGCLLNLKKCVVWWSYLPSLAIFPKCFRLVGIPAAMKEFVTFSRMDE